MSIDAVIKEAVNACFETFNEFITTAEIIVVPSVYDPTSGVVGGSEVVDTIEEVIFVNYERNRIDGQVIREFDKLALFRPSDVTVEITTEMNLRIDSEDWNIKNIKLDPSTSLYELQARKP